MSHLAFKITGKLIAPINSFMTGNHLSGIDNNLIRLGMGAAKMANR